MEQRQEQDTQAALNEFSRPIQGTEAEAFDPMEIIPTLTAGDDLQPGTTICGNFVELEKLISDKFKMSQEVDQSTGKKVSRRVVLERNGKKIAVWASGSLKQTFEKMAPGTYVEITYDGKRAHPSNESQTMHYFSFKKGKSPVQ